MSEFKIRLKDKCNVCQMTLTIYDLCRCKKCNSIYCIYCMQDWVDNDFAQETTVGKITLYTCCFCMEI